jgi:UDP-glucose 4-epimerase
VYGDGEQRRCFSFVSDTVTPLARMAFEREASRQVINVGPDDEVISINALAETIARIMNFDLKVVHVAGPPRQVRVATCSAEKARRLLGYEPKVKLEDGLRQMVEWIRERGPRPFRYHLDLEIAGERTPPTWRDRLM